MNMRKIIAVLAAALLLCAIIPMSAISVSAASAAYSIDFEDGSLGNWKTNSDASPVELVAAADLPVANPNGGNYAFKQTMGGYHYASDQTAFAVEPNTDYIVSVDALITTSNWPVEVNIGTDYWLGDCVFKSGQVKISNTAWTTLTFMFNSGNNTKLYAGFKSSWENVTVYFDNYSVIKADASVVGNTDGHLYNGDFETGSAMPWGTSANASVVSDPTGAGQGKVMNVNENAGSVTMFNQTARNLKANTYYKLSFKVYGYTTAVSNAAFWVQFPKTVTDWSVDVGASGFTSQAANDYTPRINVNTKLNAWYDVSITFNTGDLTEVNINFMNYRANGGQYYFDNIKLREMAAPSFDGYITNGNFETGDLTGWTVTAGNVTEENGNTILQGTATKKYGNFVHQIVDVEANTEYAISFRVKGAVSGGIARVYVGTGTGNTGYVNSTYTWNVSNTAWTTITVSFNSGANTQLYVNLCQGKDNGGDIYYDDILMWEVQDPSYDGYLYNGDFEIGVKGAWSTSGSTVIDTASKHDGNFGAHLSVSSASWGGMLNQTLTGLEPGATYSITFWYKVIQQGVNWKVEGETIGDNGKAVSLVANYVTAKEWTQVTKEFVADGTTARINFSGSGITEGKSTYENGIDEMYVDDVVIALVKPAHTCNVVEQSRVEADCENDGYINYACDCGLGAYTETIPAKGHTAGEAADCDSAQTCTVCGAELNAALGHSWNDATCTAPKTCSACGATEGEALGHTAGEAADCDSAQTCTVCGAELNAALGHNWNAATCTAPKTCSVCGATEGEALGHTAGEAADCDSAQICTVCGAELNAALGHSWNDATCTAPKTCSTCGATEGEALGHTYFDDCSAICEVCGYEREAGHNVIHVEAVAPTCNANGNIEYWCCDVCGMAWLDEACTLNTNRFAVVLPMTEDHVYANDFDVDCDVCGAIRDIANPMEGDGISAMELENGLGGVAAKYTAAVEGLAIKAGTINKADYTNATMGGHKLISMGVFASNGFAEVDIPCVYLMALTDDTAEFAARIIDIPEIGHDVEITFQSYFVVEIDGVATTIYGDVQTGTYNAYKG